MTWILESTRALESWVSSLPPWFSMLANSSSIWSTSLTKLAFNLFNQLLWLSLFVLVFKLNWLLLRCSTSSSNMDFKERNLLGAIMYLNSCLPRIQEYLWSLRLSVPLLPFEVSSYRMFLSSTISCLFNCISPCVCVMVMLPYYVHEIHMFKWFYNLSCLVHHRVHHYVIACKVTCHYS